MDPNTCLDRLLHAFATKDFEETYWAAEDLYTWLRRGGFFPSNPDLLDKFKEVFGEPLSMDALFKVQETNKKHR